MKGKISIIKLSAIGVVIQMFLYAIIISVVFWIPVSTMIQRFLCPKMTETELFIHIPKSIIGDWEYCDKEEITNQ